MTIPVPAKLNSRQRAEDVAGLVLTTPTITAPASDDTATVVELNGTEHRVPRDWAVAEAKHGESDIVFLRRGSEVRVLAGDREGRVHEVRGYRSAVLDEVRSSRFGAARKASQQDAEVSRLLALSDSAARPLSETGDAEVTRLVELSNSLDSSTADDAEADRLAKIAEGL